MEQNKQVASKLYKATLAMFTLPILCYYGCQSILSFENESDSFMYSGFAAVVMVNLVIFAYVWSAFHEEDENGEDLQDENKRMFDNDENTPRVGAFKQRTD